MAAPFLWVNNGHMTNLYVNMSTWLIYPWGISVAGIHQKMYPGDLPMRIGELRQVENKCMLSKEDYDAP